MARVTSVPIRSIVFIFRIIIPDPKLYAIMINVLYYDYSHPCPISEPP